MYSYAALFLLVTVIALLTPESLALQCYICSWSPKDAMNRTDYCTAGKFEPKLVHINDCEFGCEIFVQWDNNDLMEQWRRTCIQPETKMTGTCVSDQDLARRWRHCTCDSHLCNGSVSWAGASLILICSLMAVSRFLL